MMRGQKVMVTAVRHPHGEVVLDTKFLPPLYTGRVRKSPLLRGVIVLIENLALGMKSLLYSANVSLDETEEEISGGMVWVLLASSLVLAVGLFFLVPLFLTRLLNLGSSLMFNLIDGLIRLAFFLVYLKAMTLLPDIRRVFAYHGAEHKVVNAYEAGVPLELEAVKKYSTAHVRCGTSFLFIVLIISIFVFVLVGLHSLWLMVLSRLLLIPVIAALGYEAIYFGGRHADNRLVRVLMSPGLLLQSMTTRAPDDSQIEVALAALKGVIAAEQAEQTEPVPQIPPA